MYSRDTKLAVCLSRHYKQGEMIRIKQPQFIFKVVTAGTVCIGQCQ